MSRSHMSYFALYFISLPVVLFFQVRVMNVHEFDKESYAELMFKLEDMHI